jgi:hypothetical protein
MAEPKSFINSGLQSTSGDVRPTAGTNKIGSDLSLPPSALEFKEKISYRNDRTKLTEFTEEAIVVGFTQTDYPQTATNQFVKRNFPNEPATIEYKIKRAPIGLDDINLASGDDLYKWLSLPIARCSKALSGVKISPGALVTIQRSSDNFNEFTIIDIVANGGFVPNTEFKGAATPFKQRTCVKPPVGSAGTNVTPPQGSFFCPDIVSTFESQQELIISDRDQQSLAKLSPEFKDKLIQFLQLAYKKGYYPAAPFDPSDALSPENFKHYIYSGFRTISQQRNANAFIDPTRSLHTYGLAADIHFRKAALDGSIRKIPAFSDDPAWLPEDEQSYQELASIAESLGLGAGHKFKFTNSKGNVVSDSVHFEMPRGSKLPQEQ